MRQNDRNNKHVDGRRLGLFWSEDAVVDRDDLTPWEKLAYVIACRHADRNGESFLSQMGYARKMGVKSRTTAWAAVKGLMKKGLIELHSGLDAGKPNIITVLTARKKGCSPHEHPLFTR